MRRGTPDGPSKLAATAAGPERKAFPGQPAVLALMNMPYEPNTRHVDLCDTALDLLAEVEDATHKPVYVLPDWCP